MNNVPKHYSFFQIFQMTLPQCCFVSQKNGQKERCKTKIRRSGGHHNDFDFFCSKHKNVNEHFGYFADNSFKVKAFRLAITKQFVKSSNFLEFIPFHTSTMYSIQIHKGIREIDLIKVFDLLCSGKMQCNSITLMISDDTGYPVNVPCKKYIECLMKHKETLTHIWLKDGSFSDKSLSDVILNTLDSKTCPMILAEVLSYLLSR
jgi:hypothetical protein